MSEHNRFGFVVAVLSLLILAGKCLDINRALADDRCRPTLEAAQSRSRPAGPDARSMPAFRGGSLITARGNPFEAPVLDVRPRVFLRRGEFDGLTVAKLRKTAASVEFRAVRSKWRRRPMGQAIEWMIGGKAEDLQAAISGLKRMDVGGGSWSGRGPANATGRAGLVREVGRGGQSSGPAGL